MDIEAIDGDFSICQIENIRDINLTDEFFFVSRTDDELSLVCRSESIPASFINANHNWRAFRVSGHLDFSLKGILASISGVLARNDISIFAVSTYNTDYILTQEKDYKKALKLVRELPGGRV